MHPKKWSWPKDRAAGSEKLRMRVLPGLALLLIAAIGRSAEPPRTPAVERNVIYGMVSGAALLLDVYRPAKPNGFGVIFVPGSGFQAAPEYGARPIKRTIQERVYPRLLPEGETAPEWHLQSWDDSWHRQVEINVSNAIIRNYIR